jgi:hypothetical protein
LTKKSLLIIPFLFIGCGIGKNSNEESVSIPKWYIQAPKSSQYLYGTGEGYSIDEAKNSALNQIASSLSVTISSKFQKSEGYSNNDNYNTSFFRNVKNDVKAEVKKIDFSNVEIVNNKLIDGKYYILVKVDKSELFKITNEKFLILDKQIQEQLNIKTNNEYEQLRTINKSIPNIKEALYKANILYILNNSFDLKGYSDKYSSYLNKKENLLNNITISVLNPNNQFSNKLIELLNEKNYKVKNNGTVNVDISSKKRFSITYGMDIARVSVNIQVTANNKIVYSQNLEVKGISNTKEQALAKASNDFKKQISKIGIEKILGIE